MDSNTVTQLFNSWGFKKLCLFPKKVACCFKTSRIMRLRSSHQILADEDAHEDGQSHCCRRAGRDRTSPAPRPRRRRPETSSQRSAVLAASWHLRSGTGRSADPRGETPSARLLPLHPGRSPETPTASSRSRPPSRPDRAVAPGLWLLRDTSLWATYTYIII